MPPEKKVLWLWKSYWPHLGQNENFFIITSSSLSAKCEAWKNGFRLNVIAKNPFCEPMWRWERYGFLVCGCLKYTCTGRWVAGPWRWRSPVCYTTFSIPGRGCCIGTGGSGLPACWASCKTGMLQSGHTFLTSNHLMRHLWGKQIKEGRGF